MVMVSFGSVEGFVSLGLASQAAWASLDLAGCLVELGRTDHVYEYSELMLGYFVSRRLSNEAIQALAFFRSAVAARTVSSVQVQALQACLQLDVQGGAGSKLP
jgi:hypothetical protein